MPGDAHLLIEQHAGAAERLREVIICTEHRSVIEGGVTGHVHRDEVRLRGEASLRSTATRVRKFS